MVRQAVEIVYNPAKLKDVVRALAGVPKGLPKVLARAVNKTATRGRTKVIRTVAQEISIRQGDLRRRNVRMKRATYRQPVAYIIISGRRIPLIAFKAYGSRRGVSYRISRREGRQRIREAWVESFISGHWAVVRRRGRARLPLVELRGPSVPEAVRGIRALTEAVLGRELGQHLDKEIATQVGLLLRRGR